jgi:hypothetical protein
MLAALALNRGREENMGKGRYLSREQRMQKALAVLLLMKQKGSCAGCALPEDNKSPQAFLGEVRREK